MEAPRVIDLKQSRQDLSNLIDASQHLDKTTLEQRLQPLVDNWLTASSQFSPLDKKFQKYTATLLHVIDELRLDLHKFLKCPAENIILKSAEDCYVMTASRQSLCAISDMLKLMLTGFCKENTSNQNTIIFPETPASWLYWLQKWMEQPSFEHYREESPEQLLELINMIVYFQCKHDCPYDPNKPQVELIALLNENNVKLLFLLADYYGLDDLKSACTQREFGLEIDLLTAQDIWSRALQEGNKQRLKACLKHKDSAQFSLRFARNDKEFDNLPFRFLTSPKAIGGFEDTTNRTRSLLEDENADPDKVKEVFEQGVMLLKIIDKVKEIHHGLMSAFLSDLLLNLLEAQTRLALKMKDFITLDRLKTSIKYWLSANYSYSTLDREQKHLASHFSNRAWGQSNSSECYDFRYNSWQQFLFDHLCGYDPVPQGARPSFDLLVTMAQVAVQVQSRFITTLCDRFLSKGLEKIASRHDGMVELDSELLQEYFSRIFSDLLEKIQKLQLPLCSQQLVLLAEAPQIDKICANRRALQVSATELAEEDTTFSQIDITQRTGTIRQYLLNKGLTDSQKLYRYLLYVGATNPSQEELIEEVVHMYSDYFCFTNPTARPDAEWLVRMANYFPSLAKGLARSSIKLHASDQDSSIELPSLVLGLRSNRMRGQSDDVHLTISSDALHAFVEWVLNPYFDRFAKREQEALSLLLEAFICLDCSNDSPYNLSQGKENLLLCLNDGNAALLGWLVARHSLDDDLLTSLLTQASTPYLYKDNPLYYVVKPWNVSIFWERALRMKNKPLVLACLVRQVTLRPPQNAEEFSFLLGIREITVFNRGQYLASLEQALTSLETVPGYNGPLDPKVVRRNLPTHDFSQTSSGDPLFRWTYLLSTGRSPREIIRYERDNSHLSDRSRENQNRDFRGGLDKVRVLAKFEHALKVLPSHTLLAYLLYLHDDDKGVIPEENRVKVVARTLYQRHLDGGLTPAEAAYLWRLSPYMPIVQKLLTDRKVELTLLQGDTSTVITLPSFQAFSSGVLRKKIAEKKFGTCKIDIPADQGPLLMKWLTGDGFFSLLFDNAPLLEVLNEFECPWDRSQLEWFLRWHLNPQTKERIEQISIGL